MKVCHEVNDYFCFEKVEKTVSNENSETFKRCNCLSSCNSIDYDYKVYFEKMNNPGDGGNTTSMSLSIYFDDDEFIVLKRYVSFGTVSLLSNIGGILGLFLGVSFLSLVEIFYFFIIRFINNLWWSESK